MNLHSAILGIELGSTRIKAVLIDENHLPNFIMLIYPI